MGVEFAHAGGAGDVDLRQVIADHIETDKQQSFLAQGRTDLCAQPAIPFGECHTHAAPAGGEVAARLARGRDACQRIVAGRLAIDDDDAFVPGADLGQEALRHDETRPVAGHEFQHHVDIGVALAQAEDGGASHFIQRLDDDIDLLGQKIPETCRFARDQRRWHALREPGGIQLLVGVAQALRFVHDQYAARLGVLQQVGGVDVSHVERRVLAHQDRIQPGERFVAFVQEFKPRGRVAEQFQAARARVRFAIAQKQVGHFHVTDRPATRLRLKQQGIGGVFLDLDGPDRVHDHAENALHGWALRFF